MPKIVYQIALVILFTIVSIITYAQPGQGGSPPGQGGNPGSGGQGDPCARANPPPSCTSPVPFEGIEFLVVAGLALGIYQTYRRKQKSA